MLIADGLDELTAETIIPTKTIRTAETYIFQQFSTPPLIAKQLFDLLDERPKQTMLEPSAGTGMLVAQGLKRNLSVIANEIDPKRRFAFSFFFQSINLQSVNAEFIGELQPFRTQFDVVALNPPFSASFRKNNNDTSISIIHYEQALKCLKPTGELIAVGANTNKVVEWVYSKKKMGYDVLLHKFDGSEYRKMGTSYPFVIFKIAKPFPS